MNRTEIVENMKNVAQKTLTLSDKVVNNPKLIFIVYILLFIVSLSLTVYSIYTETHAVLDNKKRKFTRATTTTFIFLMLSFVYWFYTYYFCEDDMSSRNQYITYLFAFISVIVLLYGIDILTIMNNNKFSMVIFSVIVAILGLYAVSYTEIIDTKWAIVYAILFISIIFIISYNPYDAVKQLSGINILVVSLTCIFFILMAIWYTTNPFESPESYFGILSSTWLTILGLIVSACVIIALIASFGAFHKNQPTTGTYILNILIIVGILSILYNVLDLTEFLEKHPAIKLITSLILYIPCLLVNLLEVIMGEYYNTKYSTIVLIVLEIIFIIVYYYYPKIIAKLYTGDGELLVNKPVRLNKRRTIGYYENLSGNNNVVSKKIKNSLSLKVGDLVQVKQSNDLGNTPVDARILNIKKNTYDVVFIDGGTMSYNALKKWITPLDDSEIVIGSSVKALKVWLVGTITNVNSDGTYDVMYKTVNDTSIDKMEASQQFNFINSAIENAKSLIGENNYSNTLTVKNVNKGNIRMLDEIKPNLNAYKFSISFWVYIDAMPTNTNNNYTQYTSILNYSNYPNVMFKPSTNELIVAVIKNEELPNGLPSDININNDTGNDFDIVYSNKNILLQKWNQFIINYDGGTMDIFYNGELVNSSSAIVPNLVHHDLTIGTDGGVRANICNVVYYNHPLDIITINNLYTLTKIGGTPNVPEPSLFTYKI
jgi:hypothetical protein